MAKKIKVVVKRPGEKPYVTYISNTLENLQKHVEGYIEAVPIGNRMLLLCNEEGRIRQLVPNFRTGFHVIFGPAVICGKDGEEFADIPVDFQTLKKLMPQMWEV